MARHGRENDSGTRPGNGADDAAARASQLVAARANARKAAAGGERAPEKRQRGQQAQPQRRDPRQKAPGGLWRFVKHNIAYIAGVVAVALIVAVGLVALRSCSGFLTAGTDGAKQGYVSPYDWSKLDRTDGRYRYVVDGQVKSRLGIDVSDHQHAIDWAAVAGDGIEFAMIRLGYRGATEGGLYLDDQYEANLEGARDAGLDCGVYFFSQARTVEEAEEEADYVLAHLDGASLEYPIAFDSEEQVEGLGASRTAGLSADEMTAIAETFCDRVQEAGYSSIVYGNVLDLANYHYDAMQQHDIWWAEYGVESPAAGIDICMWQYSATGSVAGISTDVDMNIDVSGALE